MVANHSLVHYVPKKKMLRGLILHLFFEIWAKVEKLSEIKLTLAQLTQILKFQLDKMWSISLLSMKEMEGPIFFFLSLEMFQIKTYFF